MYVKVLKYFEHWKKYNEGKIEKLLILYGFKASLIAPYFLIAEQAVLIVVPSSWFCGELSNILQIAYKNSLEIRAVFLVCVLIQKAKALATQSPKLP